MAYLLSSDMDTHLYSGEREDITRMDTTITDRAIAAAIAEAKSYLRRFDLVKLFGVGEEDPVHEDENLKNKVKDLVLWHLVKLANPNIKVELARSCYEDAIKWFMLVQSGKIDPGFPMPGDNPDTDYDESNNIQWDSNPKRNNHF